MTRSRLAALAILAALVALLWVGPVAAYLDYLPRDRHAVVALFLECEPRDVDVNVHPAKAEVRFRDGGLVRGLIVGAIRQALAGALHQASTTGGSGAIAALRAPAFAPSAEPLSKPWDWRDSPASPAGLAEPEQQSFADFAPAANAAADVAAPTNADLAAPLGAARAQVHDAYVIAQTDGGIVIVDQHAAHERIVYERLKRQRAENGVERQILLSPIVVDLDPDAAAELVDHAGALEELGLVIEAFGRGAILLREAMKGRRHRPRVQIFGTDIDDQAIAVARLGRYRRPVAGLSSERMERWFTDQGDDVCVVPEIREMCVFSVHSIIKHPPFSKLDLVSCRNLLIYLDVDMQERLMRTFHYALKPGGWLFLGSSESVSRSTGLFDVRDKKHRIFQRREVEGASLSGLANIGAKPGPPATPERPANEGGDRIDRGARRVMDRHNPPYVVIDATDQIVRFSGPAMGQYVELSPGAPSFALPDILRKALRPPIRAVLRAARASNQSARHENAPVRMDGRSRLVTLIAEPLADHGPDAGFIVLAFQDAGVSGERAARPHTHPRDASQALEQELQTTRAQLQSTIDELETSNEELKSSNEEHQSVNEELQSSNEELETAKEEMQSVNEEIQTVNAEMLSKNEQLTRVNSDLKNLLESTEIATLFLDKDLRVKSFTPGVTDIFHIREADIGRPINEVVTLLEYADLQRDVRTVLRKLTVMERQVTLQDGRMTFVSNGRSIDARIATLPTSHGEAVTLRLLDLLEDHDDVQHVYANFDIDEKEMQAAVAS